MLCSVAQRHVNCRRTWLFVSFCRTARARQVKRSGKASEQISSSSSSSSSSVFVKFVHFATREQEKQPFIYSFQGFCSERREREEKRREVTKTRHGRERARQRQRQRQRQRGARKQGKGQEEEEEEDDECRCSLEETRFDEPQRTEVPLLTNLARE